MIDDKEPPDEEDMLHDLEGKGKQSSVLPWRGFLNVGVLVMLISGLLCLFIFYPVLTFIQNNTHNLAIDGNIQAKLLYCKSYMNYYYYYYYYYYFIGFADTFLQIPNA